MPESIDLHVHSTSSDGTDPPETLGALAAARGLSAFALTDHDTVSGLKDAAASAAASGVEFVPGIELSIEDGEVRRFHLLSYYFDQDNPELAKVLTSVRRWREERNILMIERAHKAGIDLTYDDVLIEAGPDATVVGRPHFAQALMRKGLVSSIAEAFDKYLAGGRPLNEPKPSLNPRRAAELLHNAGGITVLAHPGLIQWADRTELTRYIADLKEADALDGIECYYARYDEDQTQFFLGLAKQLGLLISGGSDYHGDNKPDITLGKVYQGKPLPAAILDPLREASLVRQQRAR